MTEEEEKRKKIVVVSKYDDDENDPSSLISIPSLPPSMISTPTSTPTSTSTTATTTPTSLPSCSSFTPHCPAESESEFESEPESDGLFDQASTLLSFPTISSMSYFNYRHQVRQRRSGVGGPAGSPVVSGGGGEFLFWTKKQFAHDIHVQVTPHLLLANFFPSRDRFTQRFRDPELEGEFVRTFFGGSRIISLRIVIFVILLLYVCTVTLSIIAGLTSIEGCLWLHYLDISVRAVQCASMLGSWLVLEGLGCWCWGNKERKRRRKKKRKKQQLKGEQQEDDFDVVADQNVVQHDETQKETEVDNDGGGRFARFACGVEFGGVVPFALVTLFLQGFATGYILTGETMGSKTALLAMVLLLRIRTIPGLLISSLVIGLSHIVGTICYLIQRELSPSSVMAFQVTEYALLSSFDNVIDVLPVYLFSLVDLFLLGVGSLVIVSSQYEANARRLFVANTRWKWICEALEAESRRKEAIVENVYIRDLVPVLKGQEMGSGEEKMLFMRKYERVVTLVNSIAGFEQFSTSVEAWQLFRVVNDVCANFDTIAQRFGVLKISTLQGFWLGIHVDLLQQRRGEEESAILAAIQMNDGFAFLLQKDPALASLSLRTGVALGRAVVYCANGGRFDVLGPSVKRARALAKHCEDSEVCVCDAIVQSLVDRDSRCCFEEILSQEPEGTSLVEDFRAYRVRADGKPVTLPRPRRKVEEGERGEKSPESAEEERSSPPSQCCTCCEPNNGFWETFRDLFCGYRLLWCEDCYLAQLTFIRFAFGIVGVMSIFYAAEGTLDTPFIPYLQIPLLALAALIVVVCCFGLFLSGSLCVGVGLQWVLFVLFHCWSLLSLVASAMKPYTLLRFRIVSGFALVVPFVPVSLPSIPFVVKIVCPLWIFVVFLLPSSWSFFTYVIIVFDSMIVFAASVTAAVLYHVQVLKYHRTRERSHKQLIKLKNETERNEELLKSALPPTIMKRLLEKGDSGSSAQLPAEHFEFGACICCEVSMGNRLEDEVQSVLGLQEVFSAFDRILAQSPKGIIKVKTSGHRYLCVSLKADLYGDVVARTSLDFLEEFDLLREEGVIPAEASLRIGIHAGGISSGLCGQTRWSWEVMGEAVVRFLF